MCVYLEFGVSSIKLYVNVSFIIFGDGSMYFVIGVITGYENGKLCSILNRQLDYKKIRHAKMVDFKNG